MAGLSSFARVCIRLIITREAETADRVELQIPLDEIIRRNGLRLETGTDQWLAITVMVTLRLDLISELLRFKFVHHTMKSLHMVVGQLSDLGLQKRNQMQTADVNNTEATLIDRAGKPLSGAYYLSVRKK
jgi:hypothetical protein